MIEYLYSAIYFLSLREAIIYKLFNKLVEFGVLRNKEKMVGLLEEVIAGIFEMIYPRFLKIGADSVAGLKDENGEDFRGLLRRIEAIKLAASGHRSK